MGLRLADVREYGLQSERCRFKGTFAPDSIATEEEKEFLWSNRRVELNAFTAPQVVEWIRKKLRQHLSGRLVPDDEVLGDAYRRALAVARINKALEEAHEDALNEAEEIEIPKTLQRKLQKSLRENPNGAWDQASTSW